MDRITELVLISFLISWLFLAEAIGFLTLYFGEPSRDKTIVATVIICSGLIPITCLIPYAAFQIIKVCRRKYLEKMYGPQDVSPLLRGDA